MALAVGLFRQADVGFPRFRDVKNYPFCNCPSVPAEGKLLLGPEVPQKSKVLGIDTGFLAGFPDCGFETAFFVF